MLFSSLFRQAVLALCAATAVTAAPSGALINPKADSNAKALMNYLLKLYNSKQVLSGQQDPVSTAWVTSNIGKTPAITGFDMMDYSPSRVAYGSKSTAVEDALSWANRGGIVCFVWHWGSPSGTYNSASEPWYSNFYTAATSFDLAAAMSNTGSNDYKLILRDIDAIATELQRLQSAGVPVLWRPLHEAEGGWFWWGAKGSGPCKALYALMYDRMTNYHGLNNLIWVWNSESTSWYPGNSAVDIVSTDLYPSAGDHSVQQTHYNTLKSLSGGTKLIALAECGVIPDPAQMLSSGVQWAYWVVWTGNFITDGNYNSRSFLTSTYNAASVMTLDKIQGWKSGGGGGSSGGGGGGSTPTTTKAGSTPTPTNPSSGGSPLYGQCGGIGWTGPTTCAAGTCKYSNAYYSQCLN